MTDPIIAAAQFLQAQLPWTRHATDDQGTPLAVTVFAEIADCAARLRNLVDGPGEQKYLGPCGAPTMEREVLVDGEPTVLLFACEGDVYGRPGAEKGRCRTCEAEVSQDDRRIWLQSQAQASDLAWTAKGIGDALNINPKTIRAWATDRYSGNVLIRRAKLSTYWRDGEKLIPWTDRPTGMSDPAWKAETTRRGDRLHYVADVVELEKQAAARREAERAKTKTQHADATG